jgi:hypothetical protein
MYRPDDAVVILADPSQHESGEQPVRQATEKPADSFRTVEAAQDVGELAIDVCASQKVAGVERGAVRGSVNDEQCGPVVAAAILSLEHRDPRL